MNEPMTQLEIERKFLLRSVPVFPARTVVRLIEQGYLPEPSHHDTGEPNLPGVSEGRLRRQVHADGTIKFTNTIKKGMGLVRTEVERELDRASFERAWPATDGRRLRKMRYLVREGELVWAVDVFEGVALILAEVELPAEDAPSPMPEWLANCVVREVTGEPAYQSYALACQAFPGLRG